MYKRILVGYDGSPSARKAFDEALKLATLHRAELLVITVARPLEIGDDVETEAIVENSRKYHRKILEDLESSVSGAGVEVSFEVSIGHPAEQIIYRADAVGADLIVVGDRGRSKFARLLLGSVSKHVVQYADRPVLVVR